MNILKKLNNQGLTIIELMTVIGIIAVVSAITVPNLLGALPNLRLKSAANDLSSSINKAKLMAARTNLTHAITFNQPIGSITYDYIFYQDTNGNLEYDAGELVIERVRWIDYPSVSLDAAGNNFMLNDQNRPSVGFRPNGLSINNIGGFGAGSVVIRNTKGTRYSIVVSSTGSVTVNRL